MRNFIAKYQPKTWEDLVLSSKNKASLEILECVAKRGIAQNLTLFGANGTGKTTIARVISSDFYRAYDEPDITDYVAMAAENTAAKFSPNRIAFHSSVSNVTWHILDEVDKCSVKGVYQILHHTLDNQHGHHYILTTNSIVDIPKGIKSRAEVITLDCPTPEEFFPRAKIICEREQIDASDEKIMRTLEAAGNDLRFYYKALERL